MKCNDDEHRRCSHEHRDVDHDIFRCSHEHRDVDHDILTISHDHCDVDHDIFGVSHDHRPKFHDTCSQYCEPSGRVTPPFLDVKKLLLAIIRVEQNITVGKVAGKVTAN